MSGVLDRKVQISDASGNAINSTAGSLNVTITGGAGSGGTSAADESTFTPGSSGLTPAGVAYETTPTSLTNGQLGIAAGTAKRGVHTNLRTSAGSEVGTAANPLSVDLYDSTGAGLTSTAGALNVSGSFTAGAITAATATAPAQTAVGTTEGLVLAANANRKKFTLQNAGTTIIKIVLGTGTVTTTNYHLALPAGGSANDGSSPVYVDTMWIGAVRALSSGAGGLLQVTELTT